ncbi:MAG: DedA family protein [Rhodospirillales bacterium]|nr:MAG: DedA family protein [Rhodospirillales bacterium]
MKSPLRPLYDWTMEKAADRRALRWLAGISFIESSFFPIPPDIMVIPMVLANRARAWLIAGICTAASVLGGFFGYAIGYFLFEAVGRPIIALYGLEDAFARFQEGYTEYGAIIVFGFGLTPLPYKVITIASGVAALNPVVFGLASLASRGLRFFLEAALLYWLGPPVRAFIEKRLELVTLAVFVLGVAGFIAVKYLFDR